MRSKGFTLVETLIAAVILFTAIGLAVLSYRSSVQLAYVSEFHVQNAKVVTIILDQIDVSLRTEFNSQRKGAGKLWGVSYQWLATPTQTFTPPPRLGEAVQESAPDKLIQFTLYEVELTLQSGQRQKRYSFLKLGWN